MRITIPGRVSRVVALVAGAATLLALLADVAAGQSQTAKLYGRFSKISIYNTGSVVPDSTNTEHSADWKYQSAWEGSSLAGKITVSVVPNPDNRYTPNSAEGVVIPDQPVNISVNASGAVQVKCEKDTNCGNATYTMKTVAWIAPNGGRRDKGCTKEDVKKGVKLNTTEAFSAVLSCPLRELDSGGSAQINVAVSLTAEVGPFWSQLGAGCQAGVQFALGLPSLAIEPSGRVDMKDDFSETVIVKNDRTRGVGPLEWKTTVLGGANWLKLNPSSGVIPDGDSQKVTLTVDAEALKAKNSAGDRIRFERILPGATPLQPELVVDWSRAPRDPDRVQISNPDPDPKTPLTPGGSATFAADVEYRLTSADAANLSVELRDQDGKVWLGTDLGRVEKGTGRRRATIPASVPDTGATLTLRALLSAGPTPVESSPITYTIQKMPDRVLIETASVRPAGRDKLESGSEVDFQATARYALNLRPNAQLALRLFDSAGTLVASSDFKNVSRTGEQEQSATLQIAKAKMPVVTAETELVLKAVLIDPLLSRVIAESSPYRYTMAPLAPPSIRLTAVGGLDEGGVGAWELALIGDAAYPRFLRFAMNARVPGFAAEYTLSSQTGRVILGLAKLAAGRVIWRQHDIGGVDVKKGEKQTVWGRITAEPSVDAEADSWQFYARLVTADGREVESKPIEYEIQRVRARPAGDSPLPSSSLVYGRAPYFKTEVNVKVASVLTWRLKAVVNYLRWDNTVRWSDSKVLREGLKAGDSFVETYEWQLSEPVEPGLAKVELFYLLESDSSYSDRESVSRALIQYPRFVSQGSLPPGSGNVRFTGGLTLSTIKNEFTRDVAVHFIKQEVIKNGVGGAISRWLGGAAKGAERWAAADLAGFLGIAGTWTIDPSIPADGSFLADVAFEYDPAMFPNDPRFSESRMQVAACDPATGGLELYPATIDVANRTATARVPSLAPCYSLGVPGPFTSSLLRGVVPAGLEAAGVVLLNTGKEEAALKLAGANRDGAQAADPVSRRLAGGAQASSSGDAGWTALIPAGGGSLRVEADRTSLRGLALLGSGAALEALPLLPEAGQLFVLPGVEINSPVSPELQLSNATAWDNEVTVELRDSTGATAGRAEVAIAPAALYSTPVGGLFPEVKEPFRGYLVVSSTQRLVASLVTRAGNALAALNGQPVGAGGGDAVRFHSAHLATGGGALTRLSLLNPTEREARITLRGWAESGSALGQPVSFSLKTGEQYLAEIGQALGLDSRTLTLGSFTVETSVGGLLGEITFGDPARYRSSVPLSAHAARSLLIPYLANGGGMATVLSVFNPNSSRASVQVKVMRPDGGTAGTGTFSVPANGRVSNPLAQVVTQSAGQNGGWIAIDSDQAVTALALVGPGTQADFAAISAEAGVGTGLAPPPAQTPSIEVTPARLEFASVQVGQSRDLSFIIRNAGGAPLTVSRMAGDNARFTAVSPATPFTVAASASQAVAVRFAPAAAGAQAGTLTISSNAANQPSLTVALSGTGEGGTVAPPPAEARIEVTPARLDFSSVQVGQSRELTLVVRNSGTAALTVSRVPSDNALFTVVSPVTPFVVAAGASQSLAVRFAPTAAGAQAGTLTISSNAANQPSLTVPLTGTGTAATGAQDLELKVDDGTFERNVGWASGSGDVLFVNRLPALSYPVKLKRVRIYVPDTGDGVLPGGTVGVVVGLIASDAELTTTSVRPAKEVLVQKLGQWLEVDVPEQSVPAGTEILVGFTVSQEARQTPAALDTSSLSQSRSYGSANSGRLEPISRFTGFDGNLAIRAVATVGQ